MGKAPTISHYTSAKGRRFLFLNGGSVKRAINRLRITHPLPTQPGNELANFAKVAFTVKQDGTIVLAAKQSAAHSYEPILTPDESAAAEWGQVIAHQFRQSFPGAHVDAIEWLTREALRGGATMHQFDAVAAFANANPATDENGEATGQGATAPQFTPAPDPTQFTPQPPQASTDELATKAGAQFATGGAPQPAPSSLSAFGALGDAIKGEISKAVAGIKVGAPTVTVSVPGYTPVTLPEGEVLHEQFARLLTACTAQDPKNRNALLLGPRGSGKTHAAEQVARSLGRAFDAVSMSGGTTERAFWGTTTIKDGNMVWRPSRFVEMFASGGVFLIDELDKADPTVVTALNMATSNGYICPVDGPGRIDRHADFVIIACANALNSDRAYTGSSRPDASSLDRFARIPWDYSPAITARAAGECGNAANAGWLIKVTNAMRKRIEEKGWRGEVEWGTRNICRVAAWLRAGQDRRTAIEWEIDTMQRNHADELRTVAQGIA